MLWLLLLCALLGVILKRKKNNACYLPSTDSNEIIFLLKIIFENYFSQNKNVFNTFTVDKNWVKVDLEHLALTLNIGFALRILCGERQCFFVTVSLLIYFFSPTKDALVRGVMKLRQFKNLMTILSSYMQPLSNLSIQFCIG